MSKTIEEKLNKLIIEWCKWNTFEIESHDFALKFHKTFKKEISPIWKKFDIPTPKKVKFL